MIIPGSQWLTARMTLRFKVTLSFLLVSLSTAVAVGGVAWWMMDRDFNQVVQDQAFASFTADVAAYVERYGSWEAAQRGEPLEEYLRRVRFRRPLLTEAPLDGPPRGAPPSVDRPPALEDGPPREGRPRPGSGEAPFRFLLLTPEGRVVHEAGPYARGQLVPREILASARPIQVGGVTQILAAQVGRARVSVQDQAYLKIMERALLAGIGMAAVLAVLLGIVVSRRMTRRLAELTDALRSLDLEAEVPVAVPVRSRDEIGQLASAFNDMGEELGRAHRALRGSHDTIRKQAAQLKEQSLRDPLTTLYNRRHFDAQARTLFDLARRNRRAYCVMVADLDHFKAINDEYSHAVGDEVLRRVARMLLDHARRSDVVARYGGEEFVAAYSECDLAGAYGHCEALRRIIEAHPWQEVAPGLQVTVSIGLCDDTGLGSVEKMLDAADARLYEAKRAGRNRVMPVPEAPGEQKLFVIPP